MKKDSKEQQKDAEKENKKAGQQESSPVPFDDGMRFTDGTGFE